MRSFVGCAAVALLVGGCGGTVELTSGSPFGPDGQQLECYGDADTAIVCKPMEELWDCSAMPNGDWKCSKKNFGTPDGASGWTCTAAGSQVTCTKPGTGISGGSDWTCTDDGTTTTCVYALTSSPPGGGTWSCSVVEFGLVCVGQPPAGSGGLPGGSSGGTSGGSSGGTSTLPPGGTSGGSSGGTSTLPPGGSSGSGPGLACSYAMIVFEYNGKIYIIKIGQDLSCIATNRTSSDATFTETCNGATYDNDPNFTFQRDNAPITPYVGPPSCSTLFPTITNKGVTAAPGVKIIFGVAHNGSFEDHFARVCPPAGGASSLAFPPICSGN